MKREEKCFKKGEEKNLATSPPQSKHPSSVVIIKATVFRVTILPRKKGAREY